jgi:hypothetical protein
MSISTKLLNFFFAERSALNLCLQIIFLELLTDGLRLRGQEYDLVTARCGEEGPFHVVWLTLLQCFCVHIYKVASTT